jgi:hypothetical protein
MPIAVAPADERATAELASSRRVSLGAVTVHVWDAGLECDVAKTLAFADTLAAFRQERHAEQDIWIFVPDSANHAAEPPHAGAGHVAVPHAFLWEQTRQILLAWERLTERRAAELMDVPLKVVRAWAARPARVARLAEIAFAANSPASEGHRVARLAEIAFAANSPASEGHLSFRWIVSHEMHAAEALSGDRVSFDHVSIHVTPEEEARVLEALSEVVGLIALTRPASIATSGRWLQCGVARLHLSSRDARPEESGFPGTAPNHIALRVRSVDEVEQGLSKRGIATARGGSLGHQLWWRLLSGTTIEFQQDDSFREDEIRVLA